MVDEYRDTTWRQGAVFVYRDSEGKERLGAIATHDCDICADSKTEAAIEYVPIKLVAELNGSMTLGKNARRLHISIFEGDTKALAVELDIRERLSMRKDDFFQHAKVYPNQLRSQEVVVFRRWLSARYARSAFANAFEVQMDRVRGRIDQLAKTRGLRIRATYFDVDDNQLIERTADEEPYALAIYVVYPPDTSDDEATKFAASLAQIFKNEFCDSTTKEWVGIELTSCDAVSEEVFPLALALSSKAWRVDHRSYSDQTDADLYPDHGS